MTRVVLVAVEVVCDPAALSAVETTAVQWAQEIRYRAMCSGAETGAAAPVVLDGTLHTLADALRAAHDGLTA